MRFINKSVGSGGKGTNDFIKNVIFEYFGNSFLEELRDGALINLKKESIITSTDSFTVLPEFFPGGDIGKLSIYGTCNDVAVSGGIPEYLTLSLIIPDGYEMEKLLMIFDSMKRAIDEVGVKIISGDTKVIDGISSLIVNTTGFGELKSDLNCYDRIKVGDKVIFSSDIARHSVAVLIARNELGFSSDIESDCCNLYEIIRKLDYSKIKFVRDATRGGVAAVLNEIADKSGKGFLIKEQNIPILESVNYFCEMLGFDPLQMANEGVAVIVVDRDYADEALAIIKESKNGKNAAIVGEVTDNTKVVLETKVGGKRYIEIPAGELLPRIC
ncbi:hydrogenase expression/formation protein HypE [Deferribacter autotrophicus]|uniref:Hydrogenase expression/formation protein HypE n=1 Tax=Deferribacter autotrophicus TaxID=500465 RepID=A0A5A8F5P3_9BACT|nr:hydrogenase expression/formation protein HypE [Deferribacter autotrophicus]KAA0258430.1 hydrogenase expression/formation protein HypE [Deferribacter autotrophicus]